MYSNELPINVNISPNPLKSHGIGDAKKYNNFNGENIIISYKELLWAKNSKYVDPAPTYPLITSLMLSKLSMCEKYPKTYCPNIFIIISINI